MKILNTLASAAFICYSSFMVAQVCPGVGGQGSSSWNANDEFILDFPTAADADFVLNNGATISIKGCALGTGSLNCTNGTFLNTTENVSVLGAVGGSPNQLTPSGGLWENTGGGATGFNGQVFIEFSNGQLLECSYDMNGELVFSQLPVDLKYLAVDQRKDVVDIVWETASEVNADFFSIEYSTNGIDFSQIDIVEAKGSETTSTLYKTVHDTPREGIAYYRLQMVDLDGSFEYSEPVTLQVKGGRNAQLLKPTLISKGQDVNLDLTSWDYNEMISVTATAMNGAQVDLGAVNGGQHETLYTDELVPGIYVVHVSSASRTVSTRLFVK